MVWLSLFVIGAAIWSAIHTETLTIFDHIFNGFVFAKVANLLALLGGMPMFISVLWGLSENRKSNFQILGFFVANLTIIILLWLFFPIEFRADPKPKTVIDRVLDIRKELERSN